MRVFLQAAPAPETGEATTFAGLPRDIEIQILGRADVQDLARLRKVSRSMRDAVDATIEDQRDIPLAAKLGCLTALKNLLQRGHPHKWVVCKFAAEGGHLKVLKWARENGCPWDEDTCSNAADGCHLEVLKWARENGCPWDSRTCTNAAAWDESTCSQAAEEGHIELLRWARMNGAPWDEDTRRIAAAKGYVEA